MTIEEKISAYIDLNTVGDEYPKSIWLCFDDYKALRLGLIAFYKEKNKPLIIWDQKWIRKGYHGVGFLGANCYLKQDAMPLPDTLEEIKQWQNVPPKED